MITPGVAQFMRLLACLCVCASVCVRLSRVCLASACICLASVSRLRASVSRLSQFVRLRLSRVCLACVCVCLASVCVWLSLCVCVCLASVSRLSRVCLRLSRVCLRLASVCVCLASVRLFTSRVPNARVCLASVRVYVRLCLCASVHVKGFRMLASVCVERRSSCLASVLVNACGNWLILCVGRHSKSLKGGGRFLLSSYYLSPCLLFYNVLMLKYPSHHLIYVFYHPMPIMPLY